MRLPNAVRITEVGPRDGLQSIADFVATDDKVRLVDRLSETGVSAIEVTSFVSPRAVPQHADAREVMSRIRRKAGVVYRALVPNITGARLCAEAGADEMVFVVSASESHNRSNVNRTVEESLAEFGQVMECARDAGTDRVSATIATAFGCPMEGVVPPDRVVELSRRLADFGARDIILADTTGMANPVSVEKLLGLLESVVPVERIAVHFHNTRGTGLANVLSAVQCGVTAFEGSVGGMGGCPFAPGATGNVPTEDMAGMLEEMGIVTGVDLSALIACAIMAGQIVGMELPGQLMRAGRVCDTHPLPQ